MGMLRSTRIGISLLVAAVATASAYMVDRSRSQSVESDSALRWARQIATQVDAMSLRAIEKGERDPLGWAIGHLTLGTEPRMIRITRLNADAIREMPTEEQFDLDRTAGLFDYSRVLNPARAYAVRIWLDTGYSGYLGTRYRLTNDLALGCTFAVLGCLCMIGTAWRRPEVAGSAPEASSPDSVPTPRPRLDSRYEELLLSTSGWHRQIQEKITRFAHVVKNLVSSATQLTKSAKVAQTRAHALQIELQRGLEDIQTGRSALKTAARLSAQSDALFKKAATPENLKMIETALNRIKELCANGETAVQGMEATMAPWQEAARGVADACESTVESARELSPAISQTRDSFKEFSGEFKTLESFFPVSAPREPAGKIWTQENDTLGISEVPGHSEPPLPRRRKSRSKDAA